MFGKSENREDYQTVDREVSGLARDLPDKFFVDFHQHARGQLIYAYSGAILVMTHQGSWVVPPLRAVWIPPYTQHSMQAIGLVELRTVYIQAKAAQNLPNSCCVISVTLLLRELIVAIVKMPLYYDRERRDGLVVKLFLQEIKPLKIVPLHLPLPTDIRLLKICQDILSNPAHNNSLEAWGKLVGASKRTLIRLFPKCTGLTYNQWNQQAKLILAIQLIAKKHPITQIAFQLGYESPSAFSAMFRKTLGLPPSAYFVDA